MPLSSMTGYARAEGTLDGYSWSWELKSVNGKGLDVRMRLPAGNERLEMDARKLIDGSLGRGHVSCTLTLDAHALESDIRVNETALAHAVRAAKKIASEEGLDAPRVETLMTLRGIVDVVDTADTDDKQQALEQALMASLGEAISGLQTARAEEGEALSAALLGHLDDITTLVDRAEACAGASVAAIRNRIREQLEELVGRDGFDPERLEQEAAQLAIKADIREELDRLKAHLEAARVLLTQEGPIGRKFDFLAQEFSREANTLCAKAFDNELSRIGLALKSGVDQLREQIQNVE